MPDMYDCGAYHFRSLSRGDSHSLRWFGPFDPHRTARQQWVIADHVGKIDECAFPAFERGWNDAQAEYLAAPLAN